MVRSNVNLDRSLQPHQLQIIQVRPYSDGVHLPCHRPRTTVDNFYGQRRIAQEALKNPNFPIAPQAGRVPELSQMPNGYSLWRIDKPTPAGRANDKRKPKEPEYIVAGHPKGLFTSVNKFMVHFIYIQIHGHKNACPCDRCVAERKANGNLHIAAVQNAAPQVGAPLNAAPQNLIVPNLAAPVMVAPNTAAPNMAAANMGAPYLAAPMMAGTMMAGQPFLPYPMAGPSTAVARNFSNLQTQGTVTVPSMAPQQFLGPPGTQPTAATLPAGQLPLPRFAPQQHTVRPMTTLPLFAGAMYRRPDADYGQHMPSFQPVNPLAQVHSQADFPSGGAASKSTLDHYPMHRRHDSLLSNNSSMSGFQGAAAVGDTFKGKAPLTAMQAMPRLAAAEASRAMRDDESACQVNGMNAQNGRGYGPLDELDQDLFDMRKTPPTSDFGAEVDLFSPTHYCIRCDALHRGLEDCPFNHA